MLDSSIKHSRQVNISTKEGGAIYLPRSVPAMYGLSQKPELLRRFQHGIFGRIQPGGNSSELTIAQTASTTGVLDVSIRCFALGYGDSPLPSGGTAQQFPCCRTQLTKGLMPGSNRNTATRHLSIKSRISPLTESWMLEI